MRRAIHHPYSGGPVRTSTTQEPDLSSLQPDQSSDIDQAKSNAAIRPLGTARLADSNDCDRGLTRTEREGEGERDRERRERAPRVGVR